MPKDASYHRSAIQYNQEIADFAEELSMRLENPEVARWSRSVSKQHLFHAGRHRRALAKLEALERGEKMVTEAVVEEVEHA